MPDGLIRILSKDEIVTVGYADAILARCKYEEILPDLDSAMKKIKDKDQHTVQK